MELAEKIAKIRKERGMTQEEFASELSVTRQAVSKWENGGASPSLDNLRTMAERFGIDANMFFREGEAPVCQSCSMPLHGINDMGANADGTANTEYCTHCFAAGGFTHNRTLEETVESNLRSLNEWNAQNGTAYTEDEARAILKMHLATLKRWNKG